MTYNSAATIEPCLRAALDSLEAGELVMVYDNASTDGTTTIVDRLQREVGDRLIVERSPVNRGFGQAVNAAVALLGETEHLLLVNPDLTLTPPAVRALRSAVEGGAGFAGPRIVDPTGRPTASPAPAPNWLYVWGVVARLALGRTTFRRLVGRLHVDRLPLPSARAHAGRARHASAGAEPVGRYQYVSGSCLALRRDAFAAAAGFDSRFFMYSEDADLCVRLAGHGYAGRYCPGATVVHATGSSGGSAVRDSPEVLDGMLRYLVLHQGPTRFRLVYHATLIGMKLARPLCPSPARGRLDQARTRLVTRAWHWSSPVGAARDQHGDSMGPQPRGPGQERIGHVGEATEAAG